MLKQFIRLKHATHDGKKKVQFPFSAKIYVPCLNSMKKKIFFFSKMGNKSRKWKAGSKVEMKCEKKKI